MGVKFSKIYYFCKQHRRSFKSENTTINTVLRICRVYAIYRVPRPLIDKSGKFHPILSIESCAEINIFLTGDFRNVATSENRLEAMVRFCRLDVSTLQNKTKCDILLTARFPRFLLKIPEQATFYETGDMRK